ncbi:MAG: lipopolysaccharide biosynthesis protein [Pseudomonadota bacterium]
MIVNSNMSSFGRHVLKMASGTVLAQAIPILGSLILTRLFTPEQFGTAAVFVGFCTVASVLTSGRYELAIVLPRKHSDALAVLVGSIGLSVITCTLGFLVILFFPFVFEKIFQNAEPRSWLYLAPAMIFLANFYQVLTYWANRRRQYGKIAANLITQQGGTVAGSVGLGFLNVRTGLIQGRLLGQLLPAIVMGIQFWRPLRHAFRTASLRRIRECFVRYRQFPLFNVPYSLSGSIARESTVFALTSFNFTNAAGCFSLARMFTFVPAGFLSGALGQVFYKEAAQHIGTPRVEQLTLKLMTSIAAIATPAFVFLMVWAPVVFSLLFGDKWHEAGIYASAYAPVGFLFLFTSWPERIYEVTSKQHISFSIQLIADALSILTLVFLLWVGVSPLLSIVAFAALSCGYQAVYLTMLFRAGGFQTANLLKLGKMILLLSTAFGVICFLCKTILPSLVLQIAGALSIIMCYYVILLRRYLRDRAAP